MNPQVLILTGLYDFSCDYVCKELQSRGVNFLRINKEHFREYRFTLDPCLPSLLVEGNGINAEINGELTSVWLRQPIFLRNTPPTPLSPQEQLFRSQWSAFPRALRVFDSASWMNDPQKTYLAESKPFQLYIADCCELQVPNSLVGNDCTRIKTRFSGDLVVKSLDSVLIREDNDCFFTYSIMTKSSRLSDANISQVPIIAQEYLHPKEDLRITITGHDLFPVRILKAGKGIQGDWRRIPKEDLEYVDTKLPPELIAKLMLFVNKIGLSFAAIDLAETDNGYYFIEVNPTGEWGWLQSDRRDIASSIADWLISPQC